MYLKSRLFSVFPYLSILFHIYYQKHKYFFVDKNRRRVTYSCEVQYRQKCVGIGWMCHLEGGSVVKFALLYTFLPVNRIMLRYYARISSEHFSFSGFSLFGRQKNVCAVSFGSMNEEGGKIHRLLFTTSLCLSLFVSRSPYLDWSCGAIAVPGRGGPSNRRDKISSLPTTGLAFLKAFIRRRRDASRGGISSRPGSLQPTDQPTAACATLCSIR